MLDAHLCPGDYVVNRSEGTSQGVRDVQNIPFCLRSPVIICSFFLRVVRSVCLCLRGLDAFSAADPLALFRGADNGVTSCQEE